jgi:hypothetical protein
MAIERRSKKKKEWNRKLNVKNKERINKKKEGTINISPLYLL